MAYSELDRLGYLDNGEREWDEDEQSIAAKGKFVKETGVGGTILWTINYGWLPRTQTNPLMDAVKESFLE